MTQEEALNALSNGKLVECMAAEWPSLRSAIQEQAGKWIDRGDHVRAMIALQEVRRLDSLFTSK